MKASAAALCLPNMRTKRVYYTGDSGASWRDISGTDGQDQTNLPDVPTHSVLIVPAPGRPNPTIIVSNDIGVYYSTNIGTTWYPLGTVLPMVDSKQLATEPDTNARHRAARHVRAQCVGIAVR